MKDIKGLGEICKRPPGSCHQIPCNLYHATNWFKSVSTKWSCSNMLQHAEDSLHQVKYVELSQSLIIYCIIMSYQKKVLNKILNLPEPNFLYPR